jgi:hypothetical protein
VICVRAHTASSRRETCCPPRNTLPLCTHPVAPAPQGLGPAVKHSHTKGYRRLGTTLLLLMLLVPREAATDLYTLYPTYTLAAPVTSTPLASIKRLMVCRRACRTHNKGPGG